MAFPNDQLRLVVQAAFGADLTQDPGTWSWTDLSDRATNSAVTISRSTAVGASSSGSATATVELTNEDGALTPYRAESPWWPNVDVGVPIRVAVAHDNFEISDSFGRTVAAGGWGTATSGQTWVAGASPANFSVASNVGRLSMGVVNVLNTITLDVALVDLDATYTVTPAVVATGGSIVTGLMARWTSAINWLALRTEFNVANTITAKIVRSDAGNQTELVNVLSSYTYSAGQTFQVRVQVAGTRLRLKFWPDGTAEPTAWTAEAVDEELSAAGRIGFYHFLVSTNTNPLPVLVTYDNLTVVEAEHVRAGGYADDWQPTFLPEGGGLTWSTVRVVIAGVSRRLDRGATPAWSPLRRSIQLDNDGAPPYAYWPLEDAAGTTRPASGLPGGSPLAVTGVVTFAHAGIVPEEAWTTRYGSRPVANLAAGGRLDAVVPLDNVADQWSVGATMQCYAPNGGAGNIFMLDWDTPGSVYVRWTLVQTTAAGYQVYAYDVDGSSTLVINTTPAYSGLNNYQVDALQSGSDITVRLWVAGVLQGSGTAAGGRVTGPSAVTVNSTRQNVTGGSTESGRLLLCGHLRVLSNRGTGDAPRYVTLDGGGWLVRSSSGWVRELAHERIERLCREEGVPFEQAGTGPESVTPLNAQQDGGVVDLLTAAAEAESGGLLYEREHGWAYLPRGARYNRTPTLTVDLASYAYSGDDDPDSVLAPVLDDQTTRTVWTIERTGGAASTVEADGAYIRRRGRVEDSKTLDLLGDGDTAQHAAWRVHRDTPNEMRYPTLPLDLAANPTLIPAWLRCDIGHRVVRTGQPQVAGRGDIDQVIDGYTETITPTSWKVAANCSPAKVWDVAVVGDARYDTAGSVLAEAATSTATSMSVATTSGPLWQPGAGLSVDLNVGGEQVTATAVTQSTVGFVAAGAAAHGNNTSVSPGLPAGLAAGHLLLGLVAIRSSGTGVPNTPVGWTTLLDLSNVKLIGKIAGVAESAPTVTFSGGAAGDDTSAQLAAFSGGFYDIDRLAVGARTQVNGSGQDIAYPRLTVRANNALIVYVGWKQDDWTSVASPGSEIGEPDTVTGNDQGLVWAYQVQTSAVDIAEGSFVVTGGVAAISRAATIAMRSDRQTFTVTRSGNAVVKPHTAGTDVRLWTPPTRAL